MSWLVDLECTTPSCDNYRFFAGCIRVAERWATLLGVVQTAQKCIVDLEACFVHLFEQQGTHRERLGRSPAQLTPMAYRDFLAERGTHAARAG